MTKRLKLNAVERAGVNYITQLFEEENCIFKEIHREHDYGHDAFVQLVDNEKVLPKEIALQVKSGHSYCNKNECKFSADEDHLVLWRDHPLRTYGIVYDPDEGLAYWVNLQAEAEDLLRSGQRLVKFPKAEWNRLDRDSFHNIFMPPLLGRPPNLSFVHACRWADSEDYILHELGVRNLLRCFRQERESWTTLFKLFACRDAEETTPHLIWAMAHIPSHPDIAYFGVDMVDTTIREEWLDVIRGFGTEQVTKLLTFMDENGFERGSIGQSVGAIISVVDKCETILKSISLDNSLRDKTRGWAKVFLENIDYLPIFPH